MILADRRVATEPERSDRKLFDGEPSDGWRGDGYVDELVTGLTPSAINRMGRDELIDVLCSIPAPFLRAESLRRLQHWDLATLRRVAHLACRCHQPQYY